MPKALVYLPNEQKTKYGFDAKALMAYGLNSLGEILDSNIVIPRGDMLTLVKNLMIGSSPIANNELGLFNIKGGIKSDKFSIASLTNAKHLWTKFKTGCQFDPKGQMGTTRAEFNLNKIEMNGKQCPDEFFGTDWEYLFGTHNPFEMMKTNEGRAALENIVQSIVYSLGQDLWSLITYGGSPLIGLAETNNHYKVTEREWADFKDQMIDTVGGFITQADFLKTAGLSNFIVPVGTTSGAEYTDSVINLFEEVRASRTTKFKTLSKQTRFGKPIWLVTEGIFNAYKKHLIDTYNNIPVSFQMLVEGTPANGVLEWDGNWIVEFPELSSFDAICGYDTHMVLATLPANVPILYDMNLSADHGLKLEASTQIKEKGAVYMYTTMKLGTGFIDPDLVTYASKRTTVPNTK